MYERCEAVRCRADGCDGWGGLVVRLPGRDTITRTMRLICDISDRMVQEDDAPRRSHLCLRTRRRIDRSLGAELPSPLGQDGRSSSPLRPFLPPSRAHPASPVHLARCPLSSPWWTLPRFSLSCRRRRSRIHPGRLRPTPSCRTTRSSSTFPPTPPPTLRLHYRPPPRSCTRLRHPRERSLIQSSTCRVRT